MRPHCDAVRRPGAERHEALQLGSKALLALGLFLPACDGGEPNEEEDESETSGGETSSGTSTGSSSEGPGETSVGEEETGNDDDLYNQPCHALLPRGTVVVGEPCNSNEDCESRACARWSNYAPPLSGTCVEPPPDCRSRATGEVLNIRTREPLVGATIGVVRGTDVAINAQGAHRIGETVVDEMGRWDVVTTEPVKAFFAVTAVVNSDDIYHTVTLLDWAFDDDDNYAPVLTLHSQYGVSKSDLAAWNASLVSDTELAAWLPLEENGVTVGVLQNFGDPAIEYLADGVITPLDPATPARVRYLNEDATSFNVEATSSTGIFIITGSQIGESFDVQVPGFELSAFGCRSGSLVGAVYTVVCPMAPVE